MGMCEIKLAILAYQYILKFCVKYDFPVLHFLKKWW